MTIRRFLLAEVREFTPSQFFLKFKAILTGGYRLQVRIYFNRGHVDYAYQLLTGEVALLRWDNKEEFKHLSSFPHHHHNHLGDIESSDLTGEPLHDLPLVLDRIKEFISVN